MTLIQEPGVVITYCSAIDNFYLSPFMYIFMYTYIHIVYIHIVYIQQKHRRSTNADAIQRNYFQNVVFRFTQLYKSDQIHDFSSSPVQIECESIYHSLPHPAHCSHF